MKKSSTLIKLIVGAIVLFVGNCFGTVRPTERGVMVTLGKPGTEILTPGLHVKAPFFQSLVTYDLTPIEYEKVFDSELKEAPVTKDKQSLGLTFDMYWCYDEARIYDVVTKYRTKDSVYEPLSSALKSLMKDEIGRWDIDEIVTNQGKIQNAIRVALESDEAVQRLPIKIQSFRLANLDWSPEYDAMIKKTMARKQEVEQMKQEVALSEQTAQKDVKKAEAEKQRIELESEAAKKKIELESEAALIKAQKEGEAKIALAEAEAKAKKVRAEAEKYEAQQIAQPTEMKRAQWSHEEKMKAMDVEETKWKHWDGDLNPKYVPITAAGTIVDMTKK